MSKSSKYGWRFWIVTLSVALVIVITMRLGFWQLDRAAQKIKMQGKLDNTPVQTLIGHWLPEHTFYLDNRQMQDENGQNKQGFYVITPLQISPSQYVLVERGWIARNFIERRQLQPFDTPLYSVSIQVVAKEWPRTKLLAPKDWEVEWPIVQQLYVHEIEQRMGQLQLQSLVRQVDLTSGGVRREWPKIDAGVNKHYGYAFQWFALCALLIGLYIWFQWIKR